VTLPSDTGPPPDVGQRPGETPPPGEAPPPDAGSLPDAGLPPTPSRPRTPGSDKPPSRRALVIRLLVMLAVFGFIFGIVLPAAGISYAEVVAAIRELTLAQLVLLTLVGILPYFVLGLVYALLNPPLVARQGTTMWLSSTAVANSIPGPVDMGLRYVLLRWWGIASEPAVIGTTFTGLADTLGRLALPIIAVFFLLIAGDVTRQLIVIAIAATGALALVIGGGIAVVRSESLARRVGRRAQALSDRVMARMGRKGPEGLEDRVLEFRANAGQLIMTRGGPASLVDVLGQSLWALPLLFALRMVGVPSSVIPAVYVYAAVAFVIAIMVLPLAPGGAGVPQLLYIAILGAIAGPEYENQVTAAVMLMWVYQWLLPIPIGWLLIFRLQRRYGGSIFKIDEGVAPATPVGEPQGTAPA